MTLSPGTRLGPYEIVAPIGVGGMGEVYRARDGRLDRQVAIKVLPPAFAQDADRLARFEREAKAVAALSHPNILSIFDFGAQEGRAYAVTELLEGETLRQRLEQGALPLRKALDYARQIAQGLAAAHQSGIIHRDLKPENVFVTQDGRVKILDFGLARQTKTVPSTGATQTAAAMTDPGTVMGTVGYMSPEQVRGLTVDARSDLFSLGAVLYEMLSGRRAFQRDTAADTMTAILKEDPPELAVTSAHLPPALGQIVAHCLEKSVVERFQSARDVAFALDAFSGSGTSPVRGVEKPRAKIRALRAALLAAAVLLAGALGGFVGHAWTRRDVAPMSFTLKTFEPQSIVNARFLPDGQSIVFSAARSGSEVELYEISAGALEARPLGPPRTHLLSVSSKGELAVLTGAHYVAQRLYKGTLARMPIEGSPRPWMEGVREADWSADGSALAIVHDVGSKDRLEYPVGTVLYETAGYVSDPRVAPDGKRVAFMDHQSRFDDRGWVKVVDAAGKVSTVAGEFWGEEGLAWSHDGSTLFFGANSRQGEEVHAGDVGYQIQSVAVARPGSSLRVMTSPGDFNLHDTAADGRLLASREDSRLGVGVSLPGEAGTRDLSWLNLSWSPFLSRDRTRVLFSDGAIGANYTVVWRKTDGSPVVRLGDGNALGWSPDERWALANIFTPPSLVLYPLGAGDPVTLARGPIDQYQGAIFFPDGKSVLVVANERGKSIRAYRQEIPGGEPLPLLDEGITPATIAPDGRTILGLDRNGKWGWYPVAGGPPQPAPGLAPDDDPQGVIGWSSDGSSLFIESGQNVPARIDRIDIATGRRQVLREVAPADLTGLIKFKPTSIAQDGAGYAYQYTKRLSTLFVMQPAP